MQDIASLLEQFREKQSEIAYLQSAKGLLSWDQETMMPPEGANARAAVESALAGVIHEKSVSRDYLNVVMRLVEQAAIGRLTGPDAVDVRLAYKAIERQQKLPGEFVRDLASLSSAGQAVWSGAYKASDFAAFRPTLERLVEMKRAEAELVGYQQTPYDALMDEFEPDTRVSDVRPVLEALRGFLTPFVRRIAASGPPGAGEIRLPAPRDVQERLNRRVAEAMGFDFARGRIDVSVHPFSNRMHAGDVRITTRYREDDLIESLTGVTHEAGHGLYEMGLPDEWYGRAIGDAISMGIHESQSRLWENIVGRSRPFCSWFAGLLKEAHIEVTADRLYRSLNVVRPSLIRVEADEVTYNLHVCLRFELELDLIEGRLAVADLPEAWNARMKEYLGIDVPDDSKGVLQDVHWSCGYFGYFPTYALGNLYAAQFYDAARHSIVDLDGAIAIGDFRPLRRWLGEKIHAVGHSMTADALVREVTGRPLDARFFTDYLDRKYSRLYQLD